MRKLKKKLKKPKKPWDRARIEEEAKLKKEFGLRRKREIWKAESILRGLRRRARDLAATRDKEREKVLLEKVHRMGLVDKKGTLDDVLSLTVNDILERRLQTIVFKKGLANTPKQSRQFITHGHVTIKGKKSKYPSYLLPKELEKEVSLVKESLKPAKKVGG